MRCWSVRRRLVHYDDGDLPPRQMAAIEQHLEICPGCSAELAQLRGAVSLVESLTQMDTRPEFTTEVLATIRARRAVEQPVAPAMWPAAVGLAFAGAVLTAALIVGVLTLDWESASRGLAAVAPSGRAVLDVAGMVLLQLVQVLDTVSRALTQPLIFALVADVVLLMAVIVVWRRLLAHRSSPGANVILA